jgi:aminopeptidase N
VSLARTAAVCLLLLWSRPGRLLAQVDTTAQTPLQYDITLVPSDTSAHLLGEVQTAWRLRTVNPVELRLDSTFRVIRVLVDGKPNTRLSRTMYARQGGEVVVPHEKAPGDTLSTRVRYHGIPRGGFRAGPNQYGERTLAATTSNGAARLWLPVPGGPPARVAVSLNVQASDSERVAGPGTLERIDTLSYGRSTWHFRLDEPVPLTGIALAAGRYVVTSLARDGCPGRCVPVTAWSYRQDEEFAVKGPFRRSGQMVDYFAGLVGTFPYPGLAHVESTLPGVTAGASVALYDEAAYRRRALDETTVARATAGQWFGNAVAPGDSAAQVLSDGLAEYLAALWLGHADGDSAFRARMRTLADSARRAGPDGASAGSSSRVEAARGAWIVHQLRGLVGDSAFFGGLAQYYRAYRDSTVGASELERIMSAAAGKDLGWYFQQALTRPGYPIVEVRWRQQGRTLALELRQTQPRAWGAFRVPGLGVRVDGRVVTVDLTGPVTRTELKDVRGKVKRVEVDEVGWWLVEEKVGR